MNKRGLTTLETSLFLILFASAIVCAHKYFRGAIQGNWKQNIDSFAEGQYNTKNSTDRHSDFINISASIDTDIVGGGSRNLNFNTPASGSECPSGVTGCLKLDTEATYYLDSKH